jgi:hypothetical protein
MQFLAVGVNLFDECPGIAQWKQPDPIVARMHHDGASTDAFSHRNAPIIIYGQSGASPKMNTSPPLECDGKPVVFPEGQSLRDHFKGATGVLIAPTPKRIDPGVAGKGGRHNFSQIDQSGLFPLGPDENHEHAVQPVKDGDEWGIQPAKESTRCVNSRASRAADLPRTAAASYRLPQRLYNATLDRAARAVAPRSVTNRLWPNGWTG